MREARVMVWILSFLYITFVYLFPENTIVAKSRGIATGATTLQISSDSSSDNLSPSIWIGPDHKVWASFVSDASKLIVGFVDQGLWIPAAEVILPFGVRQVSGNEMVMDERERIWMVLLDTSWFVRVGYIDKSRWHQVDSIYSPQAFGICRNFGDGIWYYSQSGIISARHMLSDQLVLLDTLNVLPYVGSFLAGRVDPVGIASSTRDNLSCLYSVSYYWSNSCDITFCRTNLR